MQYLGSELRIGHDSWGVGFVAPLGGSVSREVIARALTAPERSGLGMVFLPREQAVVARKAIADTAVLPISRFSTGVRFQPILPFLVPARSKPFREFGNASSATPSCGLASAADSIWPRERGERDVA